MADHKGSGLDKEGKRKLFEQRQRRHEELSCRMYRNEWPEKGDILWARVKSIQKDEGNVYLSLLEYNNLEAMMLFSEIQRRRMRSMPLHVGEELAVVVLKSDEKEGYIDVSRKRVDGEDKDFIKDKYRKSTKVHGTMSELCVLFDYRYTLEQLYRAFGWHLYDHFDHAHDALEGKAMSDREGFVRWVREHIRPDPEDSKDRVPEVTEDGPLEAPEPIDIEELLTHLFSIIDKRMRRSAVTVRATIELNCYSKHGIKGIRQALKDGLATQVPGFPLTIKLVAPPAYHVSCDSLDPKTAIVAVNKCIETVRGSIDGFGGQLHVKKAPEAITHELTAQDT